MADTRSKPHPRKRTVKPSILRDIIRRVVEAAQPDKIILFGSAARGEVPRFLSNVGINGTSRRRLSIVPVCRCVAP
jgi:hypothetical protein